VASNNYIYKMSNAGGMSTVTRYTDMLAGNTTWNPWEPDGAYDALSVITVPSGGLTSITFGAIPNIYKHLQIRALFQCNTAGEQLMLRFNNDSSSANYTLHQLGGDGSSAFATAYATGSFTGSRTAVRTQAASGSSFGAGFVDILDYANVNKNKTVRSLGGADNNGSGEVLMRSGLWLNTSSITSIDCVVSNGGTMNQHTQISLYGIK
jgi:hypothetical protein